MEVSIRHRASMAWLAHLSWQIYTRLSSAFVSNVGAMDTNAMHTSAWMPLTLVAVVCAEAPARDCRVCSISVKPEN
jgi:hypothetical protein